MSAWKTLDPKYKDVLLDLYDKGQLTSDIAEKMGTQTATLKRRLREWREDCSVGSALGNDFPSFPTHAYDDFFVVKSDNIVLSSDWELPDTDAVMVETMLLTAKRFGIRQGAILGDLVACDQAGLSTWVNSWADSESPDFEGTHGLLNRCLMALLQQLDDVWIISGNHDQRLGKVTGGQVHLGMFIQKFAPRVKFSRYRYMFLETSRGVAGLYHQSNFSNNGLAISRKMYNTNVYKEKKLKFIVTTHIHSSSTGKSEDNLAECYSLGTMRDEKRTQYLRENASAHARWSQGFCVVRNGYFYNYERDATNWQELLGDHAEGASILRPKRSGKKAKR